MHLPGIDTTYSVDSIRLRRTEDSVRSTASTFGPGSRGGTHNFLKQDIASLIREKRLIISIRPIIIPIVCHEAELPSTVIAE